MTHLLQTRLQLVDLGLFDKQVLFVQLFDDELVVVLAVDVDQHGFDGSVALDERAWRSKYLSVAYRTSEAYLEQL